jgi:hypothetical protein
MPTLLLLIAFLQGASPIVRVDSRNQGRTFYVDTDRPEIRKALRDISAPPPAGPLPAWLPPFPGSRSIPHNAANDPPDFAIALYATDAPPDAVFAHYESALRAAPATVTYMNRQPGRGGAIHVEDSLQRAVVSVSPGPRATDISVNWHARVAKPLALSPTARLTAVWYDDTRQALRLRDSASGKEYDLDMATMLRYARSNALEASARSDFPPWLAFYPGAKVVVTNGPPAGWQPQKFTDMRTYNVEMESTATVAQIADFYRDLLRSHGFSVVNETMSGDRSFAVEARSPDRMHQLHVNVLRRSKDTFIRLTDHFTMPRS